VAHDGTEEHKVAIVEQESVRVLRRRGPLRITETRHGLHQRQRRGGSLEHRRGHGGAATKDPDRSARRIRAEIARRTDVEVAVLITDTFGRVWRQGVTDVALGSAGLKPLLDLRGTFDANGRLLEATEVAIADEIARRGEISCCTKPPGRLSRWCADSTSRSLDRVRSPKTSFAPRTTISFAS